MYGAKRDMQQKNLVFLPLLFVFASQLVAKCSICMRLQKLSLPPQTLHSHDYITWWRMFGHSPASLCLHRIIEQVWFHRVIWLPAERFDAPHVHLLMARPEKDVSKASLYFPFYCSIINNHSQVKWAVTDGILFDSCLPVACFSSFLALRCNCRQSNFFLWYFTW